MLRVLGCNEPRLGSAVGLGLVTDDEGPPQQADRRGLGEIVSVVAQRRCYLIEGHPEFVMGSPGQLLDRSRIPLRLGGLLDPAGGSGFRGDCGRLDSLPGLPWQL